MLHHRGLANGWTGRTPLILLFFALDVWIGEWSSPCPTTRVVHTSFGFMLEGLSFHHVQWDIPDPIMFAQHECGARYPF